MKNLSFFLFVVCCLSFFVACQTNADNTPVVGSIDTAAIALDTNMQKGLESSYEFHKTLKVSDTLVYDVVGWGIEYSEGEYAIIRRGADNKPDTMVTAKREGVMEDALLYDISKEHLKQLYIIFRMPGTGVYGHVEGYTVPDFEKVEFNSEFPESFDASQYMGHDSFYFAKNNLYREFPLYKKKDANCCPTNGRIKISYALIYADIQIEKIERIK